MKLFKRGRGRPRIRLKTVNIGIRVTPHQFKILHFQHRQDVIKSDKQVSFNAWLVKKIGV